MSLFIFASVTCSARAHTEISSDKSNAEKNRRFRSNFLDPDPIVFIVAPSRNVWPANDKHAWKVLRLPGNPAAVSRFRRT